MSYSCSLSGTGKSLSTICASLHWLVTEEQRIVDEYKNKSNIEGSKKANNEKMKEIKESSPDDWLMDIYVPPKTGTDIDSSKSNSRTEKESKCMEKAMKTFNSMKNELRDMTDQEIKLRSSTALRFDSKAGQYRGSASTKSKIDLNQPLDDPSKTEEDGEYLMDPYDSENEREKFKQSLNESDDSDSDSDDDDSFLPQILYCSRTHSQISQFIGEIKRCNKLFENVRCISLGSRKNLCVNDSLKSRYTSDIALSEACLDLQKSKKSIQDQKSDVSLKKRNRENPQAISGPCVYHNRVKEESFVHHALGRVRDIEELVSLGKAVHSCPYYSTRRAIKHAQVVCMPYSMLLHQELRESMKIKLTDRVIIFDEAHNVIDTINQLYSAEASIHHINLCLTSLKLYLDRFQNVLHGKNLYYINLLLSSAQRLYGYLNSQSRVKLGQMESNKGDEKLLYTINNFLFSSGLDNVNFVKLSQYITKTNLINRIGGFAEHLYERWLEPVNSASKKVDKKSSSNHDERTSLHQLRNDRKTSYINSLREIVQFFRCIMTSDIDGRIYVEKANDEINLSDSTIRQTTSTIKYILFNPSRHFQTLTNDARAVILLGGTMQPFQYVISSLLPYLPKDRIRLFSCEHVISPHQVAPVVVTRGTSNRPFEFTYENRYHPDLIMDFYSFLNDCIFPAVDTGVVVFFSSYAYMNYVVDQLRKLSLFNKLNELKRIFVEPKATEEADRLLSRYSSEILTEKHTVPQQSKGAALFCVMGGKLSEGINFSDDLARCVIVVGMPYPDKKDVVLKERMAFANISQGNSTAGAKLYESICMRQVNQSIGRSIRHRHDYASIILLDQRFQQQNIISQLPSWIAKRLACVHTCKDFSQYLRSFLNSCENLTT